MKTKQKAVVSIRDNCFVTLIQSFNSIIKEDRFDILPQPVVSTRKHDKREIIEAYKNLKQQELKECLRF